MKTSLLVPFPFLLMLAAAAAQEIPVPTPAEELQKLAPLIGNWHGTGTAMMGPGGPSSWEAQSTYAWSLDKFFVQEDTVVRFADMAKPLVFRVYYGWDAENKHYVVVAIDNDGNVGVRRLDILGDGTMVQMKQTFHEGQTFLERDSTKVTGNQMELTLDALAAVGPSTRVVDGKMTRTDKAQPMAMDASAFTAGPAPQIVQLGKTAGTYTVQGSMVMMPGAPAMKITGQDQVTALFDGTIVHVHTTGTADGLPGGYVGELFYGFDARRGCIRAVFVCNTGEVGDMEGRFTPDGKNFVLTSAQTFMGQPCAQSMVLDLGADGAVTHSVGHMLLGTGAPFESWNTTYTRTAKAAAK